VEVWGDKIIMELNDSAKNGDVETAWDSSEVGADAEIEYVPLKRVENSSSPSPQPNTATLNQHNTIEGISPRDPCGWFNCVFMVFFFATPFVLFVLDLATGGDGFFWLSLIIFGAALKIVPRIRKGMMENDEYEGNDGYDGYEGSDE
jgi:hypothetical protein